MAISFAKTHIGKSLDEGITAADLITYFVEEREESLTLEFKSYAAKERANFDGVIRTVAAFLNSEGGLLIFGAPSDIRVTDDKYRIVKGDLTPIPTNIATKDSLVNRISDNISYMPIGIRVEPVSIPDVGFVYLIEVQESENKPHQYKVKNNYPVRLDGQSVGAPHYLVEALFNQVKRPELKGFLRVASYKIAMNPSDPFNTIYLRFEVTIFNVSRTINDTDVYIQLMVGAGMFVPGTDARQQYSSKGKRVTILKAASLITNGLPTRHIFDYQITTLELNELKDKNLKVTLAFGSTNSVTKFSYYIIGFKPDVRLTPSEINKSFTRPLDLYNLLEIQRDENVSSSDKWKGQEEERMELTLNGI